MHGKQHSAQLNPIMPFLSIPSPNAVDLASSMNTTVDLVCVHLASNYLHAHPSVHSLFVSNQFPEVPKQLGEEIKANATHG